ncbi:metalloendopeptidase, glycoprotease family [mine drainage metagenome]|uniref:N(6)-L-threonylcarbamoyladenine synthase n=1 Tax=mine drainage metagenome TaxID=410659 RepID=T1ATD1_9ZZZZ
MATLGIESSAHTLGIGIVDHGKVLSNVKRMYPISDKGMIPMRVADFHVKNVKRLLKDAFNAAGISINEIDAVGYTMGPGIGPCLSVGNIMAKTLASKYNIRIMPVNHAVAHIEIARRMNNFKDPLALYVSGGNSQILGISDDPFRHYHVYGETFDIGVGNMLDNFARSAGLKPAWGSSVAKLASGGRYIPMPYTVKGMDFAFTGLLTKASGMLSNENKRDIAFSMQETAFSMLCEATERAITLLGKKSLLVCGGVAQSQRLREMLQIVADSHKAKFGFAPDQYNADNGAMIALVAEEMAESNSRSYLISRCKVRQDYRADTVEITW